MADTLNLSVVTAQHLAKMETFLSMLFARDGTVCRSLKSERHSILNLLHYILTLLTFYFIGLKTGETTKVIFLDKVEV